MQLNTLAGRSYNDITQVIFVTNLLRSIIKLFYPIFMLFILSLCIVGSIQFSPGFFLITVQRAWIFLILLLTGIFQRLS